MSPPLADLVRAALAFRDRREWAPLHQAQRSIHSEYPRLPAPAAAAFETAAGASPLA